MRDHKPYIIEEFMGLWARGDADSTPGDHFVDCNNVDYIESGVKTRDGLDTLFAKGNVVRMYNYVQPTGDSLLILDTSGDFWHALLDGSDTIYGPILSIPGATDFAFVAMNTYAFISPFNSTTIPSGISQEVGLQGEFVYVYKGDGTAARKAAGFPPTRSADSFGLIAYPNINVGIVDRGIHVVAVTYSNGSGDSGALGTTIRPVVYTIGETELVVDRIPISTDPGITQRKIWMTHAIDPANWNPDVDSYTYYLAATINDNTTQDIVLNTPDSALTVAFVAGSLPVPSDNNALHASNGVDKGYCDFGLHVIGVVYETDTGFLTAPGPEVLAVQTFVNEQREIIIDNIPISPSSVVIARHIVASKAIDLFNGDDRGFQLFFVPNGVINNNTDTSINLSFYDSDLIDDASHLIDNFSEIPAFAVLNTYHQRLVGAAEYGNISLSRVSAVGEPEAISQVDGLIQMPPDGNSITGAQEFRDILYLFKQTKTSGYSDNGDEPSTWNGTVLDQGIGCSIHGIGTVLDSAGVNIDFLLIIDYSGIMLFAGLYERPELSWKIRDYWFGLDKTDFKNIQVLNDSLNQRIYISLPNRKILFADYQLGMNYKQIRFAKWELPVEATTIALINKDTLAIGAKQVLA